MDPYVDALAFAAGRGDAGAAARFVRATQRDVWRLCSFLGSHGDAEDLAQETYLRAFRSLPTFAGRASARNWLLAICRRVCADAVRQRRRQPRTQPLGDDVDRLVDRSDAVEAVLLRRAVGELDRERREAFVLTQLVGLTYDEAAEVCGCPVGTIRSRVARAREQLVSGMPERRRA